MAAQGDIGTISPRKHSMRLFLASLTLVTLATPALADGPPSFFISPMGEPFRGPDAPNIWFDQADTNHDGVLTQDEMEADAARFFAVLDRGKDGEIDPEDLEYYETVIAPMIRVGGYMGTEPESTEDGGDGDAPKRKVTYVAQGAARFGYFDYPEPVAVADTNFNRGVDAKEFRVAADKRFALLDKNGDGKIEKSELPKLEASSFKPGKRGGGGGGGRGMGGHGGGRRGGGGGFGGGGGGMGGMGPGGGMGD
jgi:Ca2+-binding EF-hand superfamily protein